MATRRQQRATYEYEKSLNKPGRVGSFAEWKREQKITEKESTPRYSYGRADVKLPGATLLIVIGLLLLWIMVTGQFDRLAKAWDYVRGNTGNLALSGGTQSGQGITDFSNFHVESMLAQPDFSFSNPGGLT